MRVLFVYCHVCLPIKGCSNINFSVFLIGFGVSVITVRRRLSIEYILSVQKRPPFSLPLYTSNAATIHLFYLIFWGRGGLSGKFIAQNIFPFLSKLETLFFGVTVTTTRNKVPGRNLVQLCNLTCWKRCRFPQGKKCQSISKS